MRLLLRVGVVGIAVAGLCAALPAQQQDGLDHCRAVYSDAREQLENGVSPLARPYEQQRLNHMLDAVDRATAWLRPALTPWFGAQFDQDVQAAEPILCRADVLASIQSKLSQLRAQHLLVSEQEKQKLQIEKALADLKAAMDSAFGDEGLLDDSPATKTAQDPLSLHSLQKQINAAVDALTKFDTAEE